MFRCSNFTIRPHHAVIARGCAPERWGNLSNSSWSSWGSMSLGGNIVPVGNLAESLQVAFDSGAKRLLPHGERQSHPDDPRELFAKFRPPSTPTRRTPRPPCGGGLDVLVTIGDDKAWLPVDHEERACAEIQNGRLGAMSLRSAEQAVARANGGASGEPYSSVLAPHEGAAPIRLDRLKNRSSFRNSDGYSGSVLDLNGAPGTIRTSDPQIRSLMLYPAELRARFRVWQDPGREGRLPEGRAAETPAGLAKGL